MRQSNRGRLVVLVPLAILFLFPFVFVVLTSLKTNSETLSNPTALLPAIPQWGNYPDVISRIDFWRELFNTLVMTLSVTFGQIILGAMAGYAFARLKFFGRDLIFVLVLATLIIPFEVLFVPIFFMLNGWHDWLNTFKALIIPSLASPFAIFVFRQFFITIPRDFEEAAMIDGAGQWRTFFSIYLPLSTSAVATVFILTFLGEWSTLLKPLVFNQSSDMYTLQQGLAITLNRGASLAPDIATAMAGVVLTSLLPVIMFLVGQRFFIRSIASSGVKG
jgi:multiple sugar transport system permease protein